MDIVEETTTTLMVRVINAHTLLYAIVAFVVGYTFLHVTPLTSVTTAGPDWPSLAILAFGILCILYWRYVTVQIDRSTGQVRVTRQWLYRKTCDQYPINTVTAVKLDRKSAYIASTIIHLDLVLAEGKPTVLWAFLGGPNTVPLLGTGQAIRSGEKIASFLNVPYQSTVQIPTFAAFRDGESIIQKNDQQ